MTWRRDKGNTGIRKLCVATACALIISAAQAGAVEQKKVLLGISAGWAFGGGYDFQGHSAGMTNDKATPGFHLGANIQYNFGEVVALQFKAGIQDIGFGWRHGTSPVEPSDWRSDLGSLLTLNLNAVVNYKKAKRSQFYMMGGSGVCFGETNRNYGVSNNGTRLILACGLGMRFFLNANQRSALNLGAAFNQILSLKKHYNSHGNSSIIQLGIGLEFYPRVRKRDQGRQREAIA
jgi:opacity protein-like surface antigen